MDFKLTEKEITTITKIKQLFTDSYTDRYNKMWSEIPEQNKSDKIMNDLVNKRNEALNHKLNVIDKIGVLIHLIKQNKASEFSTLEMLDLVYLRNSPEYLNLTYRKEIDYLLKYFAYFGLIEQQYWLLSKSGDVISTQNPKLTLTGYSIKSSPIKMLGQGAYEYEKASNGMLIYKKNKKQDGVILNKNTYRDWFAPVYIIK